MLELACDVGRVAVQHGCVAVRNVLVVHHDDLGLEGLRVEARVVLRVGGDVAAANILD